MGDDDPIVEYLDIMGEVLASPGTEAFCFHASGQGIMAGLSTGRPHLDRDAEMERQIEMLAYHLYEIKQKYGLEATEAMEMAWREYDENEDDWDEMYHDFVQRGDDG